MRARADGWVRRLNDGTRGAQRMNTAVSCAVGAPCFYAASAVPDLLVSYMTLALRAARPPLFARALQYRSGSLFFFIDYLAAH